MRKFVVLRDLQAVTTAEPFEPAMLEAKVGRSPIGPPEVRVDVEEPSKPELRHLARQPDVVSLAPVMPTALIRPVAGAEVETASAADVWGVAALWWEARGAMPAAARTVLSKLLATGRTDGFAPDVEVADRCAGLVKAP